MSRLRSYLDRRTSDWPRIRAVARKLAGLTRRPVQARQSKTVTLRAESVGSIAAAIGAAAVETAEALLEGSAGSPRCLTFPLPASFAGVSRTIALDGIPQPRFVHAPVSFDLTRQAWLRAQSVRVYPRPGLAEFQRGLVLRNNMLQWRPDHRLTPGFVEFADRTLVAAEDDLRPGAHLRKPVLVLCHVFHRNYGHWLLDCLPCVMPWRSALNQGRLKLLVPRLDKWQRRTLELMGIPRASIIETTERSVLCDDAIVPGLTAIVTEPTGGPASSFLYQPESAVVEVIRILQAARSDTALSGLPERIYVSRRGLKSFRSMLNEEEVEQALRRLGFTIVRPQNLSMDEQIEMFSRARIIAGPHGAGLTNAVFAPQGCLIVDLCLDTWATPWMVRIANAFGHDYLPLEFSADASKSEPVMLGAVAISKSRVYRIPLDVLTQAIESAMRRPESCRV